MTVPKGSKKPEKPRPDYPLYALSNGSWCKKINGKHVPFGRWDEPEAAEQNYLDWLARERLGIPQHDPDDITVDELADRYLDAQKERVKRREAGHPTNTLAPRTLREQKRHVLWFAEVVVNGHRIGRRAVSSLRAADFTAVADEIDAKLGVDSVRHRINYVNGMFNWGRKNEVIAQVPNYGTRWRIPTDNEVEKDRTSKPDKQWTKAQLKKLLANANPTMTAMIHLALNCGMGNSDVGRLRRDDINGEWLTVPRGKNGRPRRAWLWPETRAALDAAAKVRPEPRNGFEGLFFVTASGGPWTDDNTLYDGICDEFRELKIACGYNGKEFKGVHFYAIRHTFAEEASNATGSNDDDVAVSHIMGHIERAQLRTYRRQLSDARLKRVCVRVQKWLYGRKAMK